MVGTELPVGLAGLVFDVIPEWTFVQRSKPCVQAAGSRSGSTAASQIRWVEGVRGSTHSAWGAIWFGFVLASFQKDLNELIIVDTRP